MNRVVYLFFALATATPAVGAIEHGNGGDAVVCSNQTVRLLDYYEAEKRGISIDLGIGSVEQRVDYVLNRLSRVDEGRARYYKSRARYFFSNAEFLAGISLQDIDDSHHIVLDAGCLIEQIAVRIPPRFPNENRKLFTINKDLWDLLPDSHKAGLVLHEIFFEEILFSTWDFRDRPEVALSPLARLFNAKVSSPDSMGAHDFSTLLNQVRITPGTVTSRDDQGHDYPAYFIVNDACHVPGVAGPGWPEGDNLTTGCLYRPMEIFPTDGDPFVVAAQNTWVLFQSNPSQFVPMRGYLAKGGPDGMTCGERFQYQEGYGVRPNSEPATLSGLCWYDQLLK